MKAAIFGSTLSDKTGSRFYVWIGIRPVSLTVIIDVASKHPKSPKLWIKTTRRDQNSCVNLLSLLFEIAEIPVCLWSSAENKTQQHISSKRRSSVSKNLNVNNLWPI